MRVREGAESEGVEEMIDLRETLYPMKPEIECNTMVDAEISKFLSGWITWRELEERLEDIEPDERTPECWHLTLLLHEAAESFREPREAYEYALQAFT